MAISIIIAIYSEKRIPILLKGLSALQNQSYSKKEIIIVVDNNKKVFKYLKNQNFSEIRIIHNTIKRGLSVCRNLGIKAAKGDFIAFTDDDAIPDTRWLEKLCEKYNDSGVFGVGGLIKPEWNNHKINWLPTELFWTIACTYKGYPVTQDFRSRNFIGCNMSYRRIVFKEVGLFKMDLGRIGDSLLGGEETDFCLRVLNQFGPRALYFATDALVWHVIDPSRKFLPFYIRRFYSEGVTKGLIRQQYRYKARNTFNDEKFDVTGSEKDYLRYLLTQSIPKRIKKLYSFSQFLQLIMLIFSILIVGFGYVFGLVLGKKFSFKELTKEERDDEGLRQQEASTG